MVVGIRYGSHYIIGLADSELFDGESQLTAAPANLRVPYQRLCCPKMSKRTARECLIELPEIVRHTMKTTTPVEPQISRR